MSKSDGIIEKWCECKHPVAYWRDIAWIGSRDIYTLVMEPVEYNEEDEAYDIDPIFDKLKKEYGVDKGEIYLYSFDCLAFKDIFTDDIYEAILGDEFCGAFCIECGGEL